MSSDLKQSCQIPSWLIQASFWLCLFLFVQCSQNLSSDNNSNDDGSSNEDGFSSSDYEDEATSQTQTDDSSATLTGLKLNEHFTATLPVDESRWDMSSAFGPRLKASEDNRYDFHRGIDIPGDIGQSIYAIGAGTLFRAYREGSSSYPDGGNVIVIRHDLATPLNFHGQSVTRFYAVYMHLNSFGEAAQAYLDHGESQTVAAGDVLGTMGQTGETSFTHLHFEIRLATTCSLEYQTENPDASCSTYGFDPHVNPFDLLRPEASGTATLAIVSHSENSVTFRVTLSSDRLNANGLHWTLTDSENTTVLDTTLDFDNRAGFDASSTETLDDDSVSGCTVSPTSLGDEAEFYVMDYTCSIPEENRSQTLTVTATLLTTQGESESQNVIIEE